MMPLIFIPSSSHHHCHTPMTPEQSALFQIDMQNLFIILNILWLIGWVWYWICYNNRNNNSEWSMGYPFNKGVGWFILDIFMYTIWGIVILGFLVSLMR